MKTTKVKSIVAITLLLCLTIISSFGLVAYADTEIRYADIPTATPYAAVTSSETVYFTNRETSYVKLPYGVPRYNQISALPNSCGPTAGAIVVGFYDKYYEDLIPNYCSYVGAGTYKGNDSTYSKQLMQELYTLMRTNVDDVGVSETDCKNGLKTYVQNKGHNLSYTNVKSFNKVNESAYTNAINNNTPVLLFCAKMDMYNIGTNENYDAIAKTSIEGAHVSVGYGIFIVKYYNGDNLFRTDKYLHVATGLALMNTCYLKLEATDWCNAAYAVSIT